MQQKRLIIALLISTAILFLWSYLVPAKPPDASLRAPVNASYVRSQSAHRRINDSRRRKCNARLQLLRQPQPLTQRHIACISIKTPLYEVKIDSLGAEAVSWIIKKNKDSGQEIYSVAGIRRHTFRSS